MSRVVVLNLLASALTVLATVALLGAAAMVGEAPLAAPVKPDQEATVARFYDAVNDVVRTGDVSAVDGVVSPDFVFHSGGDGVITDRAGLVDMLLDLHAIAPAFQLTVGELSMAGDRAIAHLTQTNSAPVTWLGVPLAIAPPLWGQFDALRLQGDRVVELWSDTKSAPQLTELVHSRLDPLLTPDQMLLVDRLRSDAESDWSLTTAFRSRVLYVATGSLSVEVDAASLRPAVIVARRGGQATERVLHPGMNDTMVAGETLTVVPHTSYLLHHDTSQTEFLAYDISFPCFPYSGPFQPGEVRPIAAAHRTLSEPRQEQLIAAAPADLPQNVLFVSIGRLVLPPGTALVLDEVGGPLAFVVEDGTIELTSRSTAPQAARANGEAADITTASTLAAGEAARVPTEATTTLFAADGPAVILAVTVLPQHAEPNARLVELKTRYDPSNLFRMNQNIRPA